MLKHLPDVLNKTCLLGLTYFDLHGQTLKQTLLGGRVISIDEKMGITLTLIGESSEASKPVEFIIPSNLSCWFKAPAGEFHTSQEGIKIVNPDYLVTWDIHQTQDKTAEGEQQWWEWVARESEPNVNAPEGKQ